MTLDELLEHMFRRGQLIRDNWWRAYVANLERIGAELRASEQFGVDYGHLVSQLPDPALPGDGSPLGASFGPPPLPEEPPLDDFMRQHIARHGPPPGGIR